MKYKDKLELLLAEVKQQEREAITNRDVNTCERCIVREKELKQFIKLCDILAEIDDCNYFTWHLETTDKLAFKLVVGFTTAEITYAGNYKWSHKLKDKISGAEETRLLTIEDFITLIALEN
jgi:hypothetical protein